jgi:hypothetical protein
MDYHWNPADHTLSETEDLEYLLLGDLRELLDDELTAENSRWISAIVETLLELLPYEFFLEEENGYLQGVLDQCPNWFDQVERLRMKHGILFYKLRRLSERLAAKISIAEISEELRTDLRQWMRSLIAHHRHENRLLQTAWNLEIGASD